jgi:hypothetical protein
MKKLILYKIFIEKYEPFDVSECLINSVEPAKFVDVFSRITKSKNIKFNVDYEYNGNIFIELTDVNYEDIKFLFSLMGNLGYYVSEFKIDVRRNFDEKELKSYFLLKEKLDLTIFVEPHYDTEIKDIPDLLYHCTPEIYVEKILKEGLFPKSKNKISTHPPRIFLCSNLNKTISIAKQFKYRSSYECTWNILEIETKNITELKIYSDPNYKKEGGVYTLNNIKPDFIKNLNYKI